MSESISILLSQLNPEVGKIDRNCNKIIAIIKKYCSTHDVIIFPELALCGYSPEDLLYRDAFHQQIKAALLQIQNATSSCTVIVGHPKIIGNSCYNAASIIQNGKLIHTYHKQHLPNYGVFDERRYFTPGIPEAYTFKLKNKLFGLCICEDIWQEGPVEALIAKSVEIFVCINASPFEIEKHETRKQLLQKYCNAFEVMIYVNQVGGQDDLLFDGQSLMMNQNGKLMFQAPAFEEGEYSLELIPSSPTLLPLAGEGPGVRALIYTALTLGLRDYLYKNGFKSVLLGLSGGIDSALTLAIAVDALGAENVHAVFMPSQYTLPISIEDAKQQAQILGVKYQILPIESVYDSILDTLAEPFKNKKPDLTEENIQARIRGLLLMALSNQTGSLVISTSNKSETAVGYTTLYGDMVGSYAILKDVYKTTVFDLAKYRNTLSMVIPERVITRAPSAELRHNQTDQDSLPHYDILDKILKLYIEDTMDMEEIIQQGFERETVAKIINLIQKNEYKRKQAPIGPKITKCSFDRDWRYPIATNS